MRLASLRKRRALELGQAMRVILLCGLVAGLSCAPRPEPLLGADQLLGSTPEQLSARLGEPLMHSEENPNHYGAMRWTDIEGVDLLVIVKGGVGTYVSYHFTGMESFDEAAALDRIGVEPPDAAPVAVPDSRAQRWQPCGEYERLTINPDTKLVSIGSHPL